MSDIPQWGFGERLAKARNDRGLDQSAVAEHLGTTQKTVSRWETEISAPSFAAVVHLARLYRCDLTWLADGISDNHQYSSLWKFTGCTFRTSYRPLNYIRINPTPSHPSPQHHKVEGRQCTHTYCRTS